MTTETRDPSQQLHVHPALKLIPIDKEDAQVHACADAIREMDGFVLPIFIDETNQILTDDSRLRWLAAKRMNLTEVPVVVLPTLAGPAIMQNALTHRAHYTKSAIAYLSVPLLQPAFDAARAFRCENLKKGRKSPIVHSADYRGKTTVEDYAEAMGIGRTMLFSARQVRAEFEKDKKQYEFTVEGGAQDGEVVKQTLRERFEPKILRQQVDSEHADHRPIGLGGVMKAIGSIRKYDKLDGRKPDSNQLDLFIGGLTNRFRYWNDLAPEQQRQAREKIRQWLAEMPDEARDEIIAAAKELRKEARSN